MKTPEILEKIELHILRIQRLLPPHQSEPLSAADAERIYSELRQAYELSIVLRYTQPASSVSAISQVETAIEPPVKPVVEPVNLRKEVPVIPPGVAEVQPTAVQTPPAAPKPQIKPVMPAMTVAEAKVTFNDLKAEVAKEVLADKLALSKIADLAKAIALHEKFMFINELFQGENVSYNTFIEKINHLQTLDDALITVNDYADTYHWEFESKTFQKLLIYIQRRHA